MAAKAKTKKPKDSKPPDVAVADPQTALSPGNILIPADVGRGVYANLAIVYHSPEEFFLDFILGAANRYQLVARVILSPAHATRLAKVIEENAKKYDETVAKKDPAPGTSSKTQ
jgi:Protein of unknown function (DUF3467)